MTSRFHPALLTLATFLTSTAFAQPATNPFAVKDGPTAASQSTARQGALEPDPIARIGALPNGLRYIIYPNATPSGQVSLRFRFDAGSLHETDNQLGVAHFVEHMAFNGTRNVPEGEMVRMLERQGLAFGREIQATTQAHQTVYRFDIPAADAAKLDTAFLLMRELASEMLIEPEAIDRERGVILSEHRMLDIPVVRASQAQQRFLYPDQLLSRRPPIGEPAIIRAVERPAMLEYYNRLYRPERATLIVVGDVDPIAIEAEIRDRFSDWRGIGASPDDPDFGSMRDGGAEAMTFIEPGVFNQISAFWLRPSREPSQTIEQHRKAVQSRLVDLVLARRLQRLIDAGDAPFTTSRVLWQRPVNTADATTVSVDPIDGRFADSIAVVEREVRRFQQHGIADAELARAVAAMRTDLAANAARADTRASNLLADVILAAVERGERILSPSQELALFDDSVRDFDGAQASALVNERFSGTGPVIFASSDTPIVGGDAALLQAYATAQQAAVESLATAEIADWAYDDFGQPGVVVERTEVADLGMTLVRFENGVTLLVKPTSSRENEVLVSARFAGGLMTLPRGATSYTLTQGQGAFIGSGLSDMPFRDLQDSLSGKNYSAAFAATDDAFMLEGATTPADLATQLQVLAAYSTHSAWRPAIHRQRMAEAETLLGYIQATPINIALSETGRILRSGDGRFTLPSREDLAGTELETLRSIIDPALSSAPTEILIVGDITVEEAIRQTALTFGALPKRSASGAPTIDPPEFPSSRPGFDRIDHRGSTDAAVDIMAWKTTDGFTDPAEAAALEVLQSVIRGRAIDEIRERLGVAYSPSVVQHASQAFPGYGYIYMMAEVAPEKLDVLTDTITGIADDLRSRPISDDDLARALQPLLAGLATDQANNVYWRRQLAGGSWDERRFELLRTKRARLSAVTAAEVQRVARRYLTMDAAHHIRIVPNGI